MRSVAADAVFRTVTTAAAMRWEPVAVLLLLAGTAFAHLWNLVADRAGVPPGQAAPGTPLA